MRRLLGEGIMDKATEINLREVRNCIMQFEIDNQIKRLETALIFLNSTIKRLKKVKKKVKNDE